MSASTAPPGSSLLCGRRCGRGLGAIGFGQCPSGLTGKAERKRRERRADGLEQGHGGLAIGLVQTTSQLMPELGGRVAAIVLAVSWGLEKL